MYSFTKKFLFITKYSMCVIHFLYLFYSVNSTLVCFNDNVEINNMNGNIKITNTTNTNNTDKNT